MNMVEKVARAVDAIVGDVIETDMIEGGGDTKLAAIHRQHECKKIARAAIEAMRTPTEAMIKAMYDVPPLYPSHPTAGPSYQALYRAVIDAALNEKPPAPEGTGGKLSAPHGRGGG